MKQAGRPSDNPSRARERESAILNARRVAARHKLLQFATNLLQPCDVITTL